MARGCEAPIFINHFFVPKMLGRETRGPLRVASLGKLRQVLSLLFPIPLIGGDSLHSFMVGVS